MAQTQFLFWFSKIYDILNKFGCRQITCCCRLKTFIRCLCTITDNNFPHATTWAYLNLFVYRKETIDTKVQIITLNSTAAANASKVVYCLPFTFHCEKKHKNNQSNDVWVPFSSFYYRVVVLYILVQGILEHHH